MGILIESKDKTCGTDSTEEELTNVAKELMKPFMDRYMQDLINECFFYIDREYDCTECGEPTIIDIISEYVTYNNGTHVNPKVHGEPIKLYIKQYCPKCNQKEGD